MQSYHEHLLSQLIQMKSRNQGSTTEWRSGAHRHLRPRSLRGGRSISRSAKERKTAKEDKLAYSGVVSSDVIQKVLEACFLVLRSNERE